MHTQRLALLIEFTCTQGLFGGRWWSDGGPVTGGGGPAVVRRPVVVVRRPAAAVRRPTAVVRRPTVRRWWSGGRWWCSDGQPFELKTCVMHMIFNESSIMTFDLFLIQWSIFILILYFNNLSHMILILINI